MDLGIAGKKALIAGASAGLGLACAKALANEGVEVQMSARGEARLLQAARDIRSADGAKVTTVVADHGTPEGREALLAACPAPDILVITCSPPAAVGDYQAISAERWREVFELAAIGPIELMRLVVPGMAERGFGRVVNITTVGAKLPSEQRILSGASRAALCNYSTALAAKVARHNVAINCLLPGFFRTPGMEKVVDLAAHESKSARDRADGSLMKSPAGWEIPADRPGRPEELAAFCALLCSAYAGFVSGQSLAIDGGMIRTMF